MPNFIVMCAVPNMRGIPVYPGSLLDVTELIKEAIELHNDGRGSQDEEGIIPYSTRKFKIQLREFRSRRMIYDGAGNEVYAYLERHMERYMLLFYSEVEGVETTYTFTQCISLDVAQIPMSMSYINLPWDLFANTDFLPVAAPRQVCEVQMDDDPPEQKELERRIRKRRLVKV